MKVLKSGDVTIADARELMNILATEFEVTQLPELLEKFEELNN